MFTTICFQETAACDGLTNIASLADPHIRVEGDSIFIPEGLTSLLGAYAFSANGVGGRLESPSLRRFMNVALSRVFGSATLASAVPFPYNDWSSNPIPLSRSEGLQLLFDNGDNSELSTGVVFLTDGDIGRISGRIHTVRGLTASVTTTGAWASTPIILDESLPAGRYAVVGAEVIGADIQACRFLFVGQGSRPGCIPKLLSDDPRPDIFRFGGLGVWGEFEFEQIPQIEVLVTGASGVMEVFLDLMQIREGV